VLHSPSAAERVPTRIPHAQQGHASLDFTGGRVVRTPQRAGNADDPDLRTSGGTKNTCITCLLVLDRSKKCSRVCVLVEEATRLLSRCTHIPDCQYTDRRGQLLSVSCNPVLAVEQVIARCIG
jgi:hypothetical protein